MGKISALPPLRRVRWLVLRGRFWRLRWLARVRDPDTGADILGLCDHAASAISIAHMQSNHELADTFIHEALHALFPKAKERQIRRGATELLAALRCVGLISEKENHL